MSDLKAEGIEKATCEDQRFTELITSYWEDQLEHELLTYDTELEPLGIICRITTHHQIHGITGYIIRINVNKIVPNIEILQLRQHNNEIVDLTDVYKNQFELILRFVTNVINMGTRLYIKKEKDIFDEKVSDIKMKNDILISRILVAQSKMKTDSLKEEKYSEENE